VVETRGETTATFRLASPSKMMTAWATLVAVEEGLVSLDDVVGQPGCTLRHLLCHAGGYPFEGDEPTSAPGRRRIYSNTGIEMAAAAVEAAAGFPFATYLSEAVFQPLEMSGAELRGSPAHAVYATVVDVARFLGEMMHPLLISPAQAIDAVTAQFPTLAGIVPGIGRFDPCPWGLGPEIHGSKSPHWMGHRNSAATYGHFGGAGTMAWVDPVAGCGLVALTDRGFDTWAVEAMHLWPALSDAVVDAAAGR
jgi:CubicO group peptidase (beta-lactamase class C family)